MIRFSNFHYNREPSYFLFFCHKCIIPLQLMQEAVKQLEEILGLCEDSMEEYVIKHTQPVQE